MSLPLLLNSLGVGIGATLLALAAGLGVALAAAVAGPRERTVWLGLALLNFALPPFLAANAWLDLTAGWRALTSPAVVAGLSLPLTALVLATLLWPVVSLLIWGAWSRLQPEQFEADPCWRGVSLLRGLLVPAAAGELAVAAALVLVLALANFTIPTLFQVRVFTEEFWIRFNTQFDWAGALQASWPVVVFPVVLLLFLRRRPVSWPRVQASVPSDQLRQSLGSVGRWARWLAAAWLGLALAFPLFRLLGAPRTWAELPSAVAAGSHALVNTMVSAVVPATATVGLGLLLTLTRARSPRWTWLWFLLPGVFLGVGLIFAFNRPGFSALYQSFGIVLLALGVRFLAPAWALVSATVRAADSQLLEMASSLGAGPLRVFGDILWPQIARGLAVTWYVVYLLCLWDVETVVLIQPPGGETLALRIFNLLHYGHAGQVNALCVVMLSLAVAPLSLWVVGRWWVDRRARILPGLLGAVGLLAVGCGDSAGTSLSAPLSSQLFSRAEVIGSRGVAPGQFNKPRSLICDREDNLFVADFTGRIQKFSPTGQYLLQWQMPQTDLGKPKGMALDRDGDIVVVEPHYMRVNHFTPNGALVARWGTKGTGAGEFILPRAVVQNSQGEFYLSEYTVVDRVQRFSPEVKNLGRLNPPVRASLQEGLSPSAVGKLVGVWGRPGAGPGEFSRAEGLGLGPDDTLLVADSCNHRIQVFDRNGKFLRTYGRAGSNPGEFSYPYDVRVDSAGHQFVCEFGNSRITVLDAHDRVLETIGESGPGPGKFANPWAIALDSHGNLYVADSQNHRVQKLVRKY